MQTKPTKLGVRSTLVGLCRLAPPWARPCSSHVSFCPRTIECAIADLSTIPPRPLVEVGPPPRRETRTPERRIRKGGLFMRADSTHRFGELRNNATGRVFIMRAVKGTCAKGQWTDLKRADARFCVGPLAYEHFEKF